MELQDHPFFEYFGKPIARKLLQSVELKRLGFDTVIFREGDVSDGIYLVLKGRVILTKGEKNQEFIANVLEGGFFGEFGVLDGKERSAHAKSQGELTLAFIPRSVLLKSFSSKKNSAALRMAIQIVSNVRESNQKHVEELLRRERLSLLGRMVASMTHDFRNPFAIISMAAGVLRMEANEASGEYCQMIEEQIDRVTAMTEDVLDYTRDEVTVHMESINIQTLLERFRIQNEAFLSTQDTTLQIESDSCIIQADPEKMMRIFQNLIYNAVEALKGSKGLIQIHQECSETDVTLHIQDNGPGIPPEIKTTLFEPFATHGKKGGVGLGMAIAHHFIEAHGGSISFSTSKNGTVFHLNFPRSESV